MGDMATKTCARCKEEKSVKWFGKDKYKKDGLRSYCKLCRNNIAKEYRKDNPAYLARQRKYMEERRTKPGVKERQAEYMKKWVEIPGVRESKNEWFSNQIQSLSDWYVERLVRKQSDFFLERNEIPSYLIHLKRQSIKIKRLIKQKKDD